jgi:hypothetical protein
MRESEDLYLTAQAFGRALADSHEPLVRAPLDERMQALLARLAETGSAQAGANANDGRGS